MKSLVFDAGPVITLTSNGLLWLLSDLKKTTGCQLLIPKVVHEELVARPLATRRYCFEALQVQELIDKEVLTVVDSEEIENRALELLTLANTSMYGRGHNLTVCQLGEMQAIAAAELVKADVLVMDERITRSLLEAPEELRALLQRRLGASVSMNKAVAVQFKSLGRGMPIIRSVELVTIAFEKGLLDRFLVDIPNPRERLLESVLWAVKTHGAAVSEEEMKELLKLEGL